MLDVCLLGGGRENRDLTFHASHLAGDVFCCSPGAPPHSSRVLIGDPMCHDSCLTSKNGAPTMKHVVRRVVKYRTCFICGYGSLRELKKGDIT